MKIKTIRPTKCHFKMIDGKLQISKIIFTENGLKLNNLEVYKNGVRQEENKDYISTVDQSSESLTLRMSQDAKNYLINSIWQ